MAKSGSASIHFFPSSTAFSYLAKTGYVKPVRNPCAVEVPAARVENLRPQLACLLGFLEVSGDLQIVGSIDEKLLVFAHAVAKRSGTTGFPGRADGVSNISVNAPQKGVRHSEFGIDLNGAVEVGERGSGSC